MRRYYDGVTQSLVRALVRDPAVHSVYAHGSYVTDDFEPGRSDVDLVAVVAELEPSAELALLKRLRRIYLRRQAVLPIDLVPLAANEFEHGAGWLAFARARLGTGGPGGWRLLAGRELRAAEPWEPDPALQYVTEAHVDRALRTGNAPEARAALGRADEHRARHAYPTEPAQDDTSSWRVERPTQQERAVAERLAHTVSARSATLIRMPFESDSVLLLEAAALEDAGPLFDAALDSRELRIGVTTSRLAEDSWRRGFRWIAIAAGDHLAGEPLATRLRAPDAHGRRELLAHRAFAAVGAVRWHALGLRRAVRRPELLLELALVGRLVHGEAIVTIPHELAPGAAALDDDAWTLRALELWHAARPEYATPR
jgi:hypothetical protein